MPERDDAPNELNVFDVQKFIKQHMESGMDVTHPQGVVLHGKHYPVFHKRIEVFKDTPITGRSYAISHVPLESGNMIRFASYSGDKTSAGTPMRKYIDAKLLLPRTTYDHEGTWHWYEEPREAPNLDKELKEKLNVKEAGPDIHDITREWSQLPPLGSYGPNRIDSQIAPVSLENKNLIEHGKAFATYPEALRDEDMIHIDTSGQIKKDTNRFKFRIPAGHIGIKSHGLSHDNDFLYTYDPMSEQLHRLQ